MKNIILRSATGALYVALILFALLATSRAPFLIIFALITVVAMWELYHLTRPDANKWIVLADLIGGLCIFFFLWSFALTAIIFTIYLIARAIIMLYVQKGNPITDMAYSMLGIMLVAFPLLLLYNIYYNFGNMALMLFIFLWLNDTGAYIVGCSIGKHRLFERVSPKKSWEGFFGGLAFNIIAAIVIAIYFDTNLNIAQWIGAAIVVTIFGTFGDLVESLIKRTNNVKDSGNILPGHGGMLDRIDSLLLAAPALLIYITIINLF